MAYNKWHVGVPCNPNFSFEDDTNVDGLADHWTASDDEGYQIVDSGSKSHCQQINSIHILSTPFSCQRSVTVMQYRIVSGVGFEFRVMQTGGSAFWGDVYYKEDDLWHYIEVDDPDIQGSIYYAISTDSAIVQVDNVATMNILTLNEGKNPTVFSYDDTMDEEDVDSINDELYKVRSIAYRHHYNSMDAIWVYETKPELKYLKTLIGKKILLHTHEPYLYAVRVREISKNYLEGEQGACQHYEVRLRMEAF
jgi:hypothetical protein